MRSRTSPRAVSMMIGTSVRRRSSGMSERPSIFGIMMSSTMQSGFQSRTTVSPSGPSTAVRTSKPSWIKPICSISRMLFSSSMTATRCDIWVATVRSCGENPGTSLRIFPRNPWGLSTPRERGTALDEMVKKVKMAIFMKGG